MSINKCSISDVLNTEFLSRFHLLGNSTDSQEYQYRRKDFNNLELIEKVNALKFWSGKRACEKG